MSENINNSQNIGNTYKYYNYELQKYDTDEDGVLSVFEIENIQDEEGIDLLAQDLNSAQTEENKEEQIQILEAKLESVNNQQGAISSLWNGIKCLTGLGSSSDKCEQAIENFKNGEITYEEADSIISSFSEKQKSSVNLISNIATGLASVAIVGSAVMTGGLSLGVVAAAAGVGAATKAGIKFADRATNKVQGDALDGKQILKDSLSGAVDGAVSVATMGMGTAAVTSKTVAQQTLKQTVIEGAKAGAKAGAISGAVTGASDYTIEAAVEEDVEFNIEDLAKTTALNAAGGALAGGVIGGVSSGIQYNKVKAASANTAANTDSPAAIQTETTADSGIVETTAVKASSEPELPAEIKAELSQQAEDLSNLFNTNIDEATIQIDNEFGNLSSVNGVSGRAKSSSSIYEKLVKKFNNGKLTSTSTQDCIDSIGDAYGTRIQLKSLSTEEAKDIIEDCLYGYNITYDQFIKYMNGDSSALDETGAAVLEEIKGTIIDLLKEKQTQEVVDQLADAIGNGRLVITELNNYGDDITSYFSNAQLQEIADAYYIQTGKRLDLVTYDDFTKSSGTKFDLENSSDYTINIDTGKATKESGYATSQMNTKQTLSDGTTGNGEIQIRGTELNQFADAEHIPYDIRTGKIKATDTEYSDIFDIISNMSPETYEKYNSFLTNTYKYLRLKELGIETTMPDITQIFSENELSQEAMKLLDMQGLITISQRSH